MAEMEKDPYSFGQPETEENKGTTAAVMVTSTAFSQFLLELLTTVAGHRGMQNRVRAQWRLHTAVAQMA